MQESSKESPTPVEKTGVVDTPVEKTGVLDTPVVDTPVVKTGIVDTPVVATPVYIITKKKRKKESYKDLIAGIKRKGETPSANKVDKNKNYLSKVTGGGQFSKLEYRI